jgi:hypothetical protein
VTCGFGRAGPPVRSARIAFVERPERAPCRQPEGMRSEVRRTQVLGAERPARGQGISANMASESNAAHSLPWHPKGRWLVSVARCESAGQAHDRSF